MSDVFKVSFKIWCKMLEMCLLPVRCWWQHVGLCW